MNIVGLHVMIDLETLGKRPGCVIMEIGAVAFVVSRGLVQERRLEWECLLDLADCIKMGQRVEGETLAWWMAREGVSRFGGKGGTALYSALHDMAYWVGRICCWEGVVALPPHVWGNGASFDLAHLAEAYQLAGGKPWWDFWRERCFRTFTALYRDVVPWDSKLSTHGALADARRQVDHVAAVLESGIGNRESGIGNAKAEGLR
jgi:exodeoxyribonuclease VIII